MNTLALHVEQTKIVLLSLDQHCVDVVDQLMQQNNLPLYRVTDIESYMRFMQDNPFAISLLESDFSDASVLELFGQLKDQRYCLDLPFIIFHSPQQASQVKNISLGSYLIETLEKPLDSQQLYHKIQHFVLYLKQKKRVSQLIEDKRALSNTLKNQAKQLQQLTCYDRLTELPNRLQLENYLRQVLSSIIRHQRLTSVLFIDLHDFKSVNDRFGFAAGDLILKQVVTRLQTCLRTEDFIARFADDEFAVVLSEIKHSNDAGIVATKIIKAINNAFTIDQQDVQIGCNVGIATYPAAGRDAPSLIQHADIALHRAKADGPNHYQYFSKEMNTLYQQRLQIENAFTQALKQHQFFLVYQPQFNLTSKTLTGVEALVRWKHPEMGIVSPADFIPAAERSGFISQLGEWVLRKACEDYADWQDRFGVNFTLAVNVSPRQFHNKETANLVVKILDEMNMRPADLELEITESAVMDDSTIPESILYQLHDLGVRLSIDDFGTGYSSLSRLKSLPIHALKIDMSFVQDVTVDHNSAIIVKSIIALANNLKLDVVAEGIETEQQSEFLSGNHCGNGQGYFFSRPIAADQLQQFF